jgi:hypothetical protein
LAARNCVCDLAVAQAREEVADPLCVRDRDVLKETNTNMPILQKLYRLELAGRKGAMINVTGMSRTVTMCHFDDERLQNIKCGFFVHFKD